MNLLAGTIMGCMSIAFAFLTFKEATDGLDLSKNFGRGYKFRLAPVKYFLRIFSLLMLSYMGGAAAFGCFTGVTVIPFNLVIK